MPSCQRTIWGEDEPITRARERWSCADTTYLREMWRIRSLEEMSAHLSRSPFSVYRRAKKIGLKLGAPGGFETMNQIAKRHGYHSTQVRYIVWKFNVPVVPALNYGAGESKNRYVDSWLFDVAAAKWEDMENVTRAAARFGVVASNLRAALVANGEKQPQRLQAWRVTKEAIDSAVAVAREMPRPTKPRKRSQHAT